MSSTYGSRDPQSHHQRKRHKKSTGNTVVDYHKSQQYRQAEREAEQRNRAKEISSLLKDEKALEQEIERLKSEQSTDHSREIKTLQTNLTQRRQAAERRLLKQEKDSEIARQRKQAAGLLSGPKPPIEDPPRRGPGFTPPKPPPFKISPPPNPPSYEQISPPPPPIKQCESFSPLREISNEEEVEEEETDLQRNSKPLFLPTSVAVNLKKLSKG